MNAYDKVTHKLIALLAQGTVPWRKTWTGGYDNRPQNFVTKKAYRGINVMLLMAEAMLSGYGTNFWMTEKQAAPKGGVLKPEQEPALVVYWGRFTPKPTINVTEPKSRSMLRYYNVYNIEQFDGIEIPAPQVTIEFDSIAECDAVIKGFSDRPAVTPGNPAYSPELDRVFMPRPTEFESPENYYSVLFHEMVHSTGHGSRVDRKFEAGHVFNGAEYSREELVAEFGACFLAGVTGIEPAVIENSAAYIKKWHQRLKEDPSWLVYAGGAAQKAVDYILK